jgi:FkbM family methyltransferase
VLRALSYFDKEPETIKWIAGIPEGGILFDVGANIGLYTLWAGLTRGATVYAFEPESSNYATLNANLRANQLTERCRAFCTGISDKIGFDTLRMLQITSGASGHQVGTAHKAGVAQGIVTTTLDHLVYEAGLPCPSHVKIDVDGIEPAIVRGASRLLSDERLKSVLIELSIMEPDHKAVVDQLVDYGFAKDEALEKAVYAKTTGVKHTGNIIFTRP